MGRGGAVEVQEAGDQDPQEGVGGEGVALFDGAVDGADEAARAGVVGDGAVEDGVPGGWPVASATSRTRPREG